MKHFTSKMGFHTNCGDEPYDRKASKVNICLSPQPKQREKLGSILNFEEYEDGSHPRAINASEKSKGFHQKQRVESKVCKSEEVVRYMSCLPSYLEKGETTPLEKPFSLGVLDWRQLEKWQHNNADVFGMSADHSPSTSSITSSMSSKVSSSHLSSNSALPHHHWKPNRPSTSTEERSSGTKLPAGNGNPKHKSDSVNHSRVQQKLLQATQSSNLDSVNRRKDSKSLDPSLQKVAGLRSLSSETDGIISGLKGNGTPQKGKASKAKEQVISSAITDLDLSERCKTTVPKPTNNTGHQHFSACHQSDSSEGDKSRFLEENRNILYGGPTARVCHTNLRSENNRNYSFVSEHGKTRDSQVEKCFSKEIRSLNCSSGVEQTIPYTQSVSVSPARRKNQEKNNLVSKPRNLADDEILQMKVDSSESTKVRNPSPTRRFSFGMGRIGKSSNANSSDIPKHVLEIIPDSKVTSTASCSTNSTGGKSNATTRARSSPLRRLLDPLLKPKGVESRSSERNPPARGRSLKSSSGQIESPAFLSAKETVDLKGLRRDDIGGPQYTQKNGISSTQALLQVAVKNGLPLFTFTVDNCRDILAATVKELGTKENMDGWIYTFLSFSEMKKKHAQWINPGSKDRNHGFVSNIVAQMKVSDILDADSTGKRYDKSGRREFVLSAVSSREADQTAGTLPCDELAAVVVKYPRGIDCSNSGDFEGIESGSDDPISTTVILPGGHHGVPSKGEPSSLIKRWKAGGSCDCGGWDLGCQLRILAGSNQASQRLNSMKSQSIPFKLFAQDETMFVLSTFEDGIFSVEFDSSLKLIQAFSIAIAVVQSRTSSMSGETAAKSFNRAPSVEVTAKYASYPPLSPVGRV